jgi:hypothetical protein
VIFRVIPWLPPRALSSPKYLRDLCELRGKPRAPSPFP